MPRYTPLIESLPSTVPFVGPEVQERALGRHFTARLGANENVFGPSPKAIAAMQEAAAQSWMYGDSASHNLRQALAMHHSVRPENIVVGEGIDGLLGYLARLLIAGGDAVVTSDGAYPTFNFHVQGFGATLHKVAYSGNHEDPATLLDMARRTSAKLAYIANPDNPMGSQHPRETIEAMIAAMPEGTLLVLDEAYVELAPEGTAARVDPEDPRVIRMRTFSKAYGMAGARIGYAIAAEPLIRAFDKVRNHFGVSRIAQAGALAALQDADWLDGIRQKIAEARQRIAAIGTANGLIPLPSATNFVTLDCGADGDRARKLVADLAGRGIFVRMPFVPPHDRCIRVSAGTKADLDAFEAALVSLRAQDR